MTKVIVTDKIAEEVFDVLEDAEIDYDYEPEISMEELAKVIKDYHGIILRSRTKLTADILKNTHNLKVVGRAGIGVDNIDLDACKEKRISVVNAPRSSAYSVAELALGLMLALARKIPEADQHVREEEWNRGALEGYELYGKTLGLMGCGRIGGEVAKRANAFGMRVIAYDPNLSQEMAQKLDLTLVNLDTVIEQSDFISIHAAPNDGNRGMIGKEEFGKMRESAYIINCAWGPIIDEKALLNALIEGKIAGAGIDVYTSEPPEGSALLNMEKEKCVFTPHIGANTSEGQARVGITAARQVVKVLERKAPEYKVV